MILKFNRVFRKQWFIALLFLFLVILVRIPSISQPLDNDSGAQAYHARLINNGEILYGTHHPAHHLPGVYYTYALVFRTMGDRPESLKIILCAWVWFTAWAVFSIGKNSSGFKTGILAAILFIFSTSMTNLAGDSAEIELWANLPLTLIAWLGIVFLKGHNRPVVYILIGILGAASFLYKGVYIFSIVAISLTLLLNAFLKQQSSAWVVLLKQVSAIFAGVVLILGPVIAYFYSAGVLDGLWLVFKFGAGYVSENTTSLIYAIVIPVVLSASSYAVLTMLGIASTGRILIFLRKTISEQREKGLIEFLLIVWFITSIIAAGFSRLPFPHYAQLLLPPLSILCATELTELFQRSRQLKLPFRYAIVTIIFLFIVGNILYSAKDYLGGYIKYRSGEITYSEYIRDDVWLGDMNIDAMEISEYIQQHTVPNDQIFGWTNLAQIYYMSNRHSSGSIIWPDYIKMLDNPEEVLDSNPVYIVYDYKIFGTPEWLIKRINQAYQLEASIEDIKIYHRKVTTAN